MTDREMPKLLTKEETADMLKEAEWLLKDLLENNLGGYSYGNRPFYILHAFKRMIEKYGNRDVGLTWTYDELTTEKEKRT